MTRALLPLAAALVLAGCGDVEKGPQPPAAAGDCREEWGSPANERNRLEVAREGDYKIARVTEWTIDHAGSGSEQRRGCGYLFHTEVRYASFSGTWSGESLEWQRP